MCNIRTDKKLLAELRVLKNYWYGGISSVEKFVHQKIFQQKFLSDKVHQNKEIIELYLTWRMLWTLASQHNTQNCYWSSLVWWSTKSAFVVQLEFFSLLLLLDYIFFTLSSENIKLTNFIVKVYKEMLVTRYYVAKRGHILRTKLKQLGT